MNYYFFLSAPGLDCDISLVNFAPGDPAHPLRGQHVCSARPADGEWAVATHGAIKPGTILTVRPADLGLTAAEARSCLVFMSPTPVNGIMKTLPQPTGFDSTPAWRANLRVISPTTATSYQGEYPAGMFGIRRPRLVSICAMLQPGLVNALFLACFDGNAAPHGGTLRVNRLCGGELMMTMPVTGNQVNYLDLADLALDGEPELLMFSSDDIAGIPVFFCRDINARQMSLEHTHPPMELTVFGPPASRNRVIQKMRSAWMALMQHA